MTYQYKVMCGCECYIYAKFMHFSLLAWHNCCLKHLKDRIHKVQNVSSGEKSSPIFEIYKNYVWPHGCHIYNTVAYMAMTTMCTYTSKHHGLPHCKCVLCCCDKWPSIVQPSQEANKDITNTLSKIYFHFHRNFSCCTLRSQHLSYE